MKKRKKYLKILFLTMTALFIASCGQKTKSVSLNTETEETIVSEGKEENIVELNHTVMLKKEDGAQIDFWIENTGDKDIAITINKKEKKIIVPGEEGSTSVTVGRFTKEYVCKAVPSGAGGRISLAYRITQGEESET